jgi:hypothetical protein
VEQTVEEELLGALLDANEALLAALNMYEDVMRVVEERVAVEISRRDVKMDRRVSALSFPPELFITLNTHSRSILFPAFLD